MVLRDDLLALLGRELVKLGREARLGREDGRAVGDRVHDVDEIFAVRGRAVLFQERGDGAAGRVDVFGFEDAFGVSVVAEMVREGVEKRRVEVRGRRARWRMTETALERRRKNRAREEKGSRAAGPPSLCYE